MAVDIDKNKKNSNILAGVIIVVIVVLGIAYFLYSGSNNVIANNTNSSSIIVNNKTTSTINMQSKNKTTTIAENTTLKKFSSSSLYNYAHLVAQNPYNSSINYIASGAKIKEVNLTNGSVSVNITEISDSESKIVILPKGYSLYYSDTSYADDVSPNGEYSTFDDALIIVNATGYIVNQTTV
ncbi:MAG: hypothetical protein M1385_01510 [Candidatus Marsarchaeota archaeon]|nr:hypothetical protein [Candidatus Marsarchaeota archaeon]